MMTLIEYVDYAGAVVCAVTGAALWKNLSQPLRFLVLFVVVCVANNTVCTALKLQGVNNMPFSHVFTWVECSMLLFFLWLLVQKLERSFVVFVVLWSVFAGISLAAKLTHLETIDSFDSISAFTESCVIAVAVSVVLYDFARTATVKDRIHPTMFNAQEWCVSGILVYALCSSLLFAMENILVLLNENAWWIHNSISIAKHSAFVTAFFVERTVAKWKM